MTAGVPQSSTLGPSLWKTAYGEVPRLQGLLSRVDYIADDLVVKASSERLGWSSTSDTWESDWTLSEKSRSSLRGMKKAEQAGNEIARLLRNPPAHHYRKNIAVNHVSGYPHRPFWLCRCRRRSTRRRTGYVERGKQPLSE